MNYGKWYYRDYFETLKLDGDGNLLNTDKFNKETDKLKAINQRPAKEDPVFKLIPGFTCFELKTSYPGLLCGIGYHHEINKSERNEQNANHDQQEDRDSGAFYQLGMYFDYTSGLPVIPGSSIKGALKSAIEKWDFLKYKELNGSSTWKGNDKEHFLDYVFEGKGLSGYKQDIFLDAIPVESDKTLFGDDYITAHKHPLKNPTPIRFLRVNPGVTYRFRFILKDTKILVDGNEIVFSATDKEKLFEEIILMFGLGAKTNVGYGRFVESSDNAK
ncbi:CRISPR-associated protein Cmr5 [Porphyromonas gulae]|uniref:type III-B CRISPR module RAMP protein Cmr6 n=1 Tax=Porphyromonas gulae TaxID=111105 RepID=UPI0003763D5A|nr:type III-B CRISPR module RAMP protein Cmr6 [Porphyromonas gulae]KGN79502.1 CRISPR-associated protein Cmr5 [Porphyromonas gulae]KKC50743.1 CRISPR-associated protein Cmr5 [Porphyromonas gulae]